MAAAPLLVCLQIILLSRCILRRRLYSDDWSGSAERVKSNHLTFCRLELLQGGLLSFVVSIYYHHASMKSTAFLSLCILAQKNLIYNYCIYTTCTIKSLFHMVIFCTDGCFLSFHAQQVQTVSSRPRSAPAPDDRTLITPDSSAGADGQQSPTVSPCAR